MKLRKIGKKGQFGTFSIFYFMVSVFLFVMMSAGFIWMMGTLKETFKQVADVDAERPIEVIEFPCINNPNETCSGTFRGNYTEAYEKVWVEAYDSITALRMVAMVYFLALGVSIVVVGFLEKKHPFMFFVYILIVVLGVIFAPTLSNAYEGLLQTGVFDGELDHFTPVNFLMLRLPLVVMVVGILSAIGLFINLIRMGDEVGL